MCLCFQHIIILLLVEIRNKYYAANTLESWPGSRLEVLENP